jgi:hypothetical protein
MRTGLEESIADFLAAESRSVCSALGLVSQGFQSDAGHVFVVAQTLYGAGRNRLHTESARGSATTSQTHCYRRRLGG